MWALCAVITRGFQVKILSIHTLPYFLVVDHLWYLISCSSLRSVSSGLTRASTQNIRSFPEARASTAFGVYSGPSLHFVLLPATQSQRNNVQVVCSPMAKLLWRVSLDLLGLLVVVPLTRSVARLAGPPCARAALATSATAPPRSLETLLPAASAARTTANR
jgi:hypothetical protein